MHGRVCLWMRFESSTRAAVHCLPVTGRHLDRVDNVLNYRIRSMRSCLIRMKCTFEFIFEFAIERARARDVDVDDVQPIARCGLQPAAAARRAHP